MRQAIIDAVPDGPGAVRAAIDAMRTEASDVERLAYESAVMGDLAGQMFVRLVEGDRKPEPLAMAADPNAPFLSLPFDEALQWWLRKGGSRETLDEVLRAWRKRSALAASMQFDTISARAVAEIERTLAEGRTLRDFQRDLETEAVTLGISPAGPGYLENVYRTNVASAYGAGRFAQLNDPALLSARPYRQWRTSGDSRVRPEHAVMRGVTWLVGNAAFATVAAPASYQCFPGDTIVQGTFDLGMRAWYDGEIVEVLTESGRRLSVTPNHPIATVHGFTSAGSIREGDHLLGYEAPIDDDRLAAPEFPDRDEEHAPASIEQVFRALAERAAPVAVNHSALDFHGDAEFFRGGVDVVGADGQLWSDGDSAPREDRDQLVLASSDVTRDVGEVRERALHAGRHAFRDAGGSAPRSTALALDGGAIRLEARPFHPLRFGPASRLNASRNQNTSHRAARDAVFIGEMLLGTSGQVSSDQVVSVRRYPWSGHVYDLQSPYGWIVASGIVTSNCRCITISYSQADVDEEGIVIADAPPPGFFIEPGFGAAAFAR